MLRRLIREETGAQTLEFLALFPLVILTMLVMLQTAFLGYALVVVETGAREAALAASRESGAKRARAAESTADKVAGSLIQSVTVACSGDDVTVQVTGVVPNVLFQSPFTFTRKVTMPTQDGKCL
ncbi:MAG: pilus assembly protein [Symbiobacteriaceae bacterium]|uniref:Pilus assembly protein n=1 Tax=Symbiobacterium thermophilum TaxID=2734 RepID=A0A953LLD7_SYMTR|nr:TadE family protein [Symbiobacterium thermophilum]MBY6278047.1 hypothetical protein [Symbiobacterium thermophilum]PZN69431.1 MAG: hypothetical protein DIU55_12980 [Bacillota bacterium]